MTLVHTSVIFVIALLCVLVVAPAPSSAFSISSLLGGGNNDDTVSENAPRQPLLDATDWFLTEQEITDSRGGSPRKDLATYTTGNAVTIFTASNEFFNTVYDDLSSTKAGDRVLLTAWAAALVPLKPDVDLNGTKTRLDKVMAGVVKRGGSVNILGWASIQHRTRMIAVRKAINDIPASPVNGAKAIMILDDRLPYPLSSHHQKTIVIAASSSTDANDQPVAYIGGLDFQIGRWDTKYHNESEIRMAIYNSSGYKGWDDSHLRIHGPAAKDIASNFVARWNSKKLPCQGLSDDLFDYKNPEYDNVASLDYASSKTSAKIGKQSIQIVRTFSCDYKDYEFAPYGENSIFKAHLKAIKNAKNFIYIEDQYFILVPELLDALLEILPTIQRVVVVTNPQTDVFSTGGYIKYSYEMINPLVKKFPEKFKIYTTKTDRDVFVHSKMLIVDDVYLSVGSANWNRRSMTSDSEIAANVIDGDVVKAPEGVTVKKMARDFRIRKMQEMTGLSYKKLDAMTFLQAADQFEAGASESNKASILQQLTVEYHAYFIAITDGIRKISDPQDTCST
ncbi:PhosphoLipase D [Phytophthora megakarya]|uniref:phospholipase D n=1 Tax=Phytophthora megakarya TaxID=4795 RepID=A0A225US29_9STRA|nr:PhosphoLipase D [Phytophthora megakarya]